MSDVEQEAVEAEIEIPKSVKVGNREVVLTLPKSISVRYEIAGYYNTNSTRALAAALGLCWGAGVIGRPKAKYEDSFNVGVYGGQVFDELISKGVSAQEIALAGSWAYVLIARSIPQAKEVDRAEGN